MSEDNGLRINEVERLRGENTLLRELEAEVDEVCKHTKFIDYHGWCVPGTSRNRVLDKLTALKLYRERTAVKESP